MKVSAQGRENRNARGLATARAIEREAVHLAALHGVDGITVDQICAAVGVSQRTFFHHFDTKEDALLGLDLPRLDETKARAYLSDPGVGILTGAVGLVELPAEHLDAPQTMLKRLAVLSSSPALAQRQMARMLPIAIEVEKIVLLKLSNVAPDIDDDTAARAATTITRLAASMMIPAPAQLAAGTIPAASSAADSLRELEWIWARLL